MMALYERELSRGPTSYKTQVVRTRFGDTHIVIGGPKNGDPLLLFHGWNGSAAGIGGEFPFLFSSYRVYMPDIIGHAGKSAPHRLPLEGPDYAHWTSDLLDALALDQIRVLGISGGGWMTLKFAAYYSDRIVKAVALSTDGLSSVNLPGVICWMLPAAIFPNRFTVKRFFQFTTSSNGEQGSGLESFAEMLALLKHFKTQRNPGLLSDQELSQITAPLLVLMGADERIFSPQKAITRAEQLIPGLVNAEIVPNAGHMMTIDQPGFLSQRILGFLH